MADIKISQLPAATTPLAGTEEVPLVQSGTTKKVTVTNLRGSGVTAVTATAPVVSSGGTTPVISMAAATTSVNGYLTSTDWNTFNNKQPAGSYLTSGGALGTPSSGTATNLTGLPLSTGVTGTLPVANGGTGTASPSIVAGTNVTVSGTWPNQTINATGGGGGSGTVTSVAATVPSFLSVTGSPITTSGTLAIAYSGTALPVLNGGTGVTTSTGSGSTVLSTSPTFVTPILGTPTSATLTNATGLPLSTGVTGTLPILNGGTGQTTANTAFNALAPSQAANTNKYLKTDGTNTSWAVVPDPAAATPTDDGLVYGLTQSTAPTTYAGWADYVTPYTLFSTSNAFFAQVPGGVPSGNIIIDWNVWVSSTVTVGDPFYAQLAGSSKLYYGVVTAITGGTSSIDPAFIYVSNPNSNPGVPFTYPVNFTFSSPPTAINGNTSLGYQSSSNGGKNTIVGYGAGSTVVTGSNLTVVGYDSEPSSGLVNNEATFGNSTTTNTRFYGSLSVGGSSAGSSGQFLASTGSGTAPTWTTLLPVANGGTGTATPSLVQGTNVTITGTWPNQTINSSGGGGMTYPGAGIANSTGTAWGTSYTTTGSGTVVALAASPTITAPLLNQINDTNNNQILGLSPTTSAVDYLVVKNGIGVGVPLHIYADGASANTGLHIQPKGTGLVTISDGTDFNKGIRFRSSSSAASAITLLDAVSSAGRVVTLPDATTTLVGRDTTDTLTNKTINLTSNTLVATSAQMAAAVSDETGSGSLVFATSPTLVTPILGTPQSATLTNATGLPISTGVSGLGTNVATFLATPSSANLASALTDETGSGALVFGTAPALTNPTVTSYTETVYTLSGTVIDPANGTIQTKTLGSSTTFTESLADGQSVVLMINPVTYTVTWPTMTWINTTGSGAAPTLEASSTNVVVMWQVGGTVYGNWAGSA